MLALQIKRLEKSIKRPVLLPLLVSLLFVIHGTVYAQSVEADLINQELKSLYEQGKCEQAYDYAHQHLLAMEGNAAFDFYYGLCALGVDAYAEARFAFERLVALYPEQNRFRLEFGRTLYGLKQYELANAQFEEVLSDDPPPAVRANIQSFLTGIKRQQAQGTQSWSGAVGFSAGVDSNINNATELETFSGITLSPASRSIHSSYYGALSNLNVDKKINQRYRTGARFSTQHKTNAEVADYDFDTLLAQSFFARKYKGGEWEIGVSYVSIRVDGQSYENDAAMSATWRKTLSRQLQSQLTLAYTRKDFDTYLEQTSDQPSLSLAVLRPVSQSLHAVFFNFSRESARDQGLDDRMRAILRLRYRYSQLIKKQWEFFAEAGYTQTQYQDEHPLFSIVREDKAGSALLGTQWHITKNWRASFEAGFSDNQSNLTLYDYDRFYSKCQALWSF